MNNPIPVPRHTKTPRVVLRGKSIFIAEKPDGWHIVLFEDDVPVLLRVLQYADRVIAHCHAKAFADHYDAQWFGWDE